MTKRQSELKRLFCDSDYLTKNILLTLEIIDMSFQTQYEQEFRYLFLSPERITLERLAELCHGSPNKIHNDLKKLETIISNTILVYQRVLV